MTRMASLIGGIKAVALGSLTGTSLMTLVTLFTGLGMITSGGESVFGGLLVILLPFLIGAAGGAAGLVLVGLPLTWWLRRKRAESNRAYTLTGAVTGGGLPFLYTFVALQFGLAAFVVGFFGLLTGGATGHFWWRFARRPVVETGEEQMAEVFG